MLGKVAVKKGKIYRSVRLRKVDIMEVQGQEMSVRWKVKEVKVNEG